MDVSVQGNLRAARQLVLAFRTACHCNDEDADSDAYAFAIDNSGVFNQLLLFCLRNMHRIFDRLLDYTSDSDLHTCVSLCVRRCTCTHANGACTQTAQQLGQLEEAATPGTGLPGQSALSGAADDRPKNDCLYPEERGTPHPLRGIRAKHATEVSQGSVT